MVKLLRAFTLGLSVGIVPAQGSETELIRLVRQNCRACNGMTLQGGLGTPLTREALADVARIAEVLGLACRVYDVLFSTSMLKKTGLRIAP
jgi:hypothetical protein